MSPTTPFWVLAAVLWVLVATIALYLSSDRHFLVSVALVAMAAGGALIAAGFFS